MKLFHLQKKKILRGLIIGLAVAAAVDLLFMGGIFDSLEMKSLDARARVMRAEKKAHPDIALVLIDEASLKAMNPLVGRWPWPRAIYRDLMDFLTMGGARAVVFDIIFPEYEEPGGLGPNDEILVESTAETGNVYHAAQILLDEEDEVNKGLLNQPMPQDFIEYFALKNLDAKGLEAQTYNNYYLPFSELYQASKGVGIVEFSPDSDGVYRRTRLFRHYQGSYFPVISLAVLLDEIAPDRIKTEGRIIKMNGTGIPLLDDGNYLINMYREFNSFSISGIFSSIQSMEEGEVENLMVAPEEFNNKIVLVGASAVGVEDLKATSLENRMPGVMLHASVISNILEHDFLEKLPRAATRGIIYALSIILALLLLTLSVLTLQMVLPFLTMASYIAVAFWQYGDNLVLDLVPPLSALFFVWFFSFVFLYFSEGRDKRKVKRMLGQYVSPAVLKAVVDSGAGRLTAEVGARENLTILFSDIRGFTTLSEKLDAAEVVALLNRYLSKMVDIIFKYDGTLDKFIGDAVMAFWGAPVRVSDHGRLAVEAAIEMIRGVEALNGELDGRGFPPLKIGIGLHTGEVILGNIGSEKKLDYTIIGDNVNLASRLEGLTKTYGAKILISEATYRMLDGAFPCRLLDQVRVMGKAEPIRIYSVMVCNMENPEEVALKYKICRYTEAAFSEYLARDFEGASAKYAKLKKHLRDDVLSETFVRRCKNYMDNPPPPEWDGVFTMKTK